MFGGLQLIIWHLEAVKRLDGKNMSPTPPLMRVLVTRTLLIMGEQSIGRAPAVAAHLSWSDELKVMVHLDHLSGRVASSLGRAAFTS